MLALTSETSVRVVALHGLALLSSVLLAACGDEPQESVILAQRDAGVVVPDAGQCAAAESRPCTCPSDPSQQGKQVCYNGIWLGCNCVSTQAPPVSLMGDCWPGRYEGNFVGLYYSGFTFAGIPIPVTGVDLSGEPPLVLQLEESVNLGGGEFPIYTVSDGYIKGTADGLFPFEAKLTGGLDCQTKQFVGEMDGWYSLLLEAGLDLNKGYFKGPITATYNAATHAFEFGEWNVVELKNGNPVPGWGLVLTELGGGGSWDATHSSLIVRPDAGAGVDAGTDAGPYIAPELGAARARRVSGRA